MAARRNRVVFSANVIGLSQHMQRLRAISTKSERKAILRKGARVLSTFLKANTPKDTGNLRFLVKDLTWRRSEDYFSSHKKKAGRKDPFYAAFLNEGFYPGGGKTKVTKHEGYIEKSVKQGTPAVQAKVRQEVDKFIKRAAKG